MTEQEWLPCTDPAPMLEFLKGKASQRKLRLFAVGCCRRIWHLLANERSHRAVEIAEQYADGRVGDEHLRVISGEAASVGVGFGVQFSSANAAHFAALPGEVFAGRCAMYAARAVANPGERDATITHPSIDAGAASSDDSFGTTEFAEKSGQAALLRCIFGNPFRPITLDPSWLTSQVVNLAQEIYEDRAFDRLPRLGTALEEAGCNNPEILNHCRGPGTHVRGCWVVDAVLRKG